MDLDSLKATDVDDASLDATLKDWFNTDTYPEATFELVSVNDGDIVWDLAMNGITKRILFPAMVIIDETSVVANADFSLDRTQWNITEWAPAVSQFMDLSFELVWLPDSDEE